MLRSAILRRSLVQKQRIVYTITDEAPALATRSLLPIFQAFLAKIGVQVHTSDISVAARILAQFADILPEHQRVPDNLANLGELAKKPECILIKLPNVSASIPQLTSAIHELQQKGYAIPDYDKSSEYAPRYAKVLGSAVNPVLREGNSDRRVAEPVKNYAQLHPHKLYPWKKDSKCDVASMTSGDFYGSEQSVTVDSSAKKETWKIVFEGAGEKKELGTFAVEGGDVVDSSFMSIDKLTSFYEQALARAEKDGVLFSLHLKATMMKVSDPILFSHAVRAYFKDIFAKHESTIESAKGDARHGVASVIKALKTAAEKGDSAAKEAFEAIEKRLKDGPEVAMVNSDKGITNLHVPSDVIIDASMPNVVRDGGCMYARDGSLKETLCVIPDRCYATIYKAMFDHVKKAGQFDVKTMGTVTNVGLMAKKAEEYGSHDKTFEAPAAGSMKVVDSSGKVVMEHKVAGGDVWRACVTKNVAIQDWVKLAVTRAQATGWPTVFWLDSERAHDREIIKKVHSRLGELGVQAGGDAQKGSQVGTGGKSGEVCEGKEDVTCGTHGHVDVRVMKPADAMTQTCEWVKNGQSTNSVTGNVLRDYLTDLFPILELGTSAKMLSIVPMLAGGAMYETGAGGSAPKHVQQFVEEGHLRWDSIGEYQAMAAALDDLARKGKSGASSECAAVGGQKEASPNDVAILAEGLNKAVGLVLQNRKSPSRKVKELDNRGTNYYLAQYWARALADAGVGPFESVAKDLEGAESEIVKEMIECQGQPVDIGGYWQPDDVKADSAMRPSETLKKILEAM